MFDFVLRDRSRTMIFRAFLRLRHAILLFRKGARPIQSCHLIRVALEYAESHLEKHTAMQNFMSHFSPDLEESG